MLVIIIPKEASSSPSCFVPPLPSLPTSSSTSFNPTLILLQNPPPFHPPSRHPPPSLSHSFCTFLPPPPFHPPSRHSPPPPSPFIHVYTLFFRIENHHPGIVFFARDYASRDQIYNFIHLTIRLFSRNTTVRMRT